MGIETENDINDLIKSGIEESTNLEYKDPDSLNNNREIAKDISAMANSNGGVIIYGLCEDEKDHKPKSIKWINNPQHKERIEQIIQSGITPQIDVSMRTILNTKNDKEFILVVEIPKSDRAPHQDHSDKDKRIYWRRNGFTTRQMEHYEVEDLFFKRKRPLLQIGLRNISKGRDEPVFEVYLSNVGKVVAEQTYIKLLTPRGYTIDGWVKKDYDYLGYSSYEHVLRDDLVYPGLNQIAGIIYSPKKFEFGILKINFIIVCKDMEVLDGEIFIDFEGNKKVNYKVPETRPYSQQVSEYIFLKTNPFTSTNP